MHDAERAIAEEVAHPTFKFTTVGEPTITPPRPRPHPAVVGEFARAIDYHRWCWDCGTTARDCNRSRPERKCCPDCRHRDADAILIDALLTDGPR